MTDERPAARLLLLDTAGLYYRSFFGVPESIVAPDGTVVNALRGVLDALSRLLTLSPGPVRIVACWDDDWRPAWRVALLPSYKAHRVIEERNDAPDIEETPEALIAQLPLIREALGLLGIPILGAAGYEADDIIGALSAQADGPVDIVTSDRDLFQLVDDERDVRVLYTARGMNNLEIVTDEVIVRKYGVHASQYADFATLRGDPSDGLPGVRGVGDKTAASLIGTHGGLAEIRAAARRGEGMSPAVRTRILDAAGYLDAAPAVVRVATDLPVRAEEKPLVSLTPEAREAALAFAVRWGVRSAMERAIDARGR